MLHQKYNENIKIEEGFRFDMTVTVSDILAIALLCSAVATIIVFASVMYSSRINDNKNDSDEDDQE